MSLRSHLAPGLSGGGDLLESKQSQGGSTETSHEALSVVGGGELGRTNSSGLNSPCLRTGPAESMHESGSLGVQSAEENVDKKG